MDHRKHALDPALERYYSDGGEQDRLSFHRLEKDRTLRILKKWLPKQGFLIKIPLQVHLEYS